PGVAVKVAADGEILVKGPNVMLGYYRDRKLTRESIRRGWFHTGDFGALRGYGLVLECRKDGMFKLTNGERVVSQVVENALAASPLIQYAVAVGSGKDFVAALIFPNLRALGKAARRRGYRTNGGNLLGDGRIRSIISAEVAKFSQCIGEKYARPKALILSSREPSLANGELTPTMKVVRSKVAEDYARDIEAVFCPDKFARAVIRL
ncbi:MAG: long-chain fatty acid--CoA ligase, partial [Elusimicrobiota bacterium]